MIFCVEDDNNIRELMTYSLMQVGFGAKGFETPEEFWAEMHGAQTEMTDACPELIILDIMLPGEDGISILKKLRADPRTANIPIIMATAKGTEFDKVTGLDLGADDYLTKPFGMMEMISRVRAVLRRSASSESSVLHMGDIELNKSEHIIRSAGKEITATLKEYELLLLFMKNPGRAFTRDSLLTSVWDSTYVGETRTVDVHIASLRAKLGPSGDLIKTIRGVGYRMEDTK